MPEKDEMQEKPEHIGECHRLEKRGIVSKIQEEGLARSVGGGCSSPEK